MALVHGRNTYLSLGGSNLTPHVDSSTWAETSDTHEVTTYGNDSKVYQGGLKDGTLTMEGFYDDTAAGAKAIVGPLVGANATLIYRAEGTATGRPEESADCLVQNFEQSQPVGGMVRWSADLQLSGPITLITQA